MKKFQYFGVSKNEITILLRELSFPIPKEVGVILTNLSVRGDKKVKKSWTNETVPEYYYGNVEQMFGQLELGYKNNRPHYQLWISMKPQVPRTGMIRELSKKFYNQNKSSSISVLTLSLDNKVKMRLL